MKYNCRASPLFKSQQQKNSEDKMSWLLKKIYFVTTTCCTLISLKLQTCIFMVTFFVHLIELFLIARWGATRWFHGTSQRDGCGVVSSISEALGLSMLSWHVPPTVHKHPSEASWGIVNWPRGPVTPCRLVQVGPCPSQRT